MTTLTLFFVLMSFMAVSIACNHPPTKNKGISSYCKKSQLYSRWYPPTPIECCDQRGQCDHYIEPNETKYGLTNPDPNWRRRLCSCDEKLYECIEKVSNSFEMKWALEKAFSDETCFHKTVLRFNGTSYEWEYVFVSVLSLVQTKAETD